ncbi:Kinocilin [Merluccius polli]|uniref:Kinocilin n=1 Tax=Merluccius polli TaxID=89951 RepID=A0AA47NRC6_MERPO|nr:Kinocilin [Merluccius polli]
MVGTLLLPSPSDIVHPQTCSPQSDQHLSCNCSILIPHPSVGGIVVSIAAFQAVDPGSIPGQRIIFYHVKHRQVESINTFCRRPVGLLSPSVVPMLRPPHLGHDCAGRHAGRGRERSCRRMPPHSAGVGSPLPVWMNPVSVGEYHGLRVGAALLCIVAGCIIIGVSRECDADAVGGIFLGAGGLGLLIAVYPFIKAWLNINHVLPLGNFRVHPMPSNSLPEQPTDTQRREGTQSQLNLERTKSRMGTFVDGGAAGEGNPEEGTSSDMPDILSRRKFKQSSSEQDETNRGGEHERPREENKRDPGRRTLETQGEQERPRENKRDPGRRTRETQGEQERPRENKRDPRRTRETQGGEDERLREEKTRNPGRRTRENQQNTRGGR